MRSWQRLVGLVALSVSVDAAADLPTEIRLFQAGVNESVKGGFLFDDEAARLVMAAWETHGADLMFDLEHLSLEPTETSVNFNPDAMGWAKLELRAGELWAVGVRWTEQGAQRLRSLAQRYISPAFRVDPKTGRIVELVNVAITSLPATHGLRPLVAASAAAGGGGNSMNEEQLAKLIEALGLEAGATYEDAIAAMAAIVKAAGSAAMGEASAPSEEAPMETSAKPDDETTKELTALRAALLRDTGAPTPVQALSQVAAWKASHLALEADRAKLAREREALELGERKALVAELVALGAETPHTSGLAAGKPCKRLLDEPIASLRDRVVQLRSAKGARQPAPPASRTAASVEGLSERELAMCTARKLDPAQYLATKRAIEARSNPRPAAQES